MVGSLSLEANRYPTGRGSNILSLVIESDVTTSKPVQLQVKAGEKHDASPSSLPSYFLPFPFGPGGERAGANFIHR